MRNILKYNIYIIISKDGIFFKDCMVFHGYCNTYNISILHLRIPSMKLLHCTHNFGQQLMTLIGNFNVHLLLGVLAPIKS